jgi:hypothetical protein
MKTRLAAGLVATTILTVSCGGTPPRARPASAVPLEAPASALTGSWTGHGRTLTIDRRGNTTVALTNGCCDPLIEFAFRISTSTT